MKVNADAKISLDNRLLIRSTVDSAYLVFVTAPSYGGATVYNMKQTAQTFLYLRERDLTDKESLSCVAGVATDCFNELNTKIKIRRSGWQKFGF